ncbi:unnamed protein product [Calypogeia fissa]
MAHRRATEGLLLLVAHRRALVSYLSSTSPNKFQNKLSSTQFHEDHMVVASWGTLQQNYRGFSSHSSAHASSFSAGPSIPFNSNGSSSSSEVVGEKVDTGLSSEDEHEQSATRVWKDEGDDFVASADGALGEAADVDHQKIMDSNIGSIGGEVESGTIWSILRAPADGVVALVDGLHTLTGTSWWLTIIGSTLAFRTALFPFTVTYMKKSAQFASSISLLPPIRPPKDSNRSLGEQYRIFTKRRLELGIPSPFWATAGLLQAPLFLYWIIALRGMAMSHHPGFESGGALWFVDLTVPVHGAFGALFPTVVALTHFTNVQVSFRAIKPRNDLTGFFMKIYQWWLEAVTIPLFIVGFYLPQGVFMYWLTNNCFNLAQSIALQNDGFRGKVGLPLLSDLEKLRSKQASQPVHADNNDLEVLNLDTLLKSATVHVTQDRDEEALKLLEFVVKKYPDEAEAYNVYGMLHIKKKQWSEAIEYYSLAISKATDDSQRITAFMGAGISLYNQGQRQEAISVMKPLVDIQVPQEPLNRQKYLRALVTLGSALSQEGLKEEALSVLAMAVKWDRSIEVYIKQLKQDLDNS